MNKFLFHCLFLYLFLFFSAHAYSQDENSSASPPLEVSISTKINQDGNILAFQPFEWQIIVQWNGEMGRISPEVTNNPIPETLNLLNQSTTLRAGTENDQRIAKKIFTYILQSSQPGEFTINPAEITYALPDEDEVLSRKTAPQTIQVESAPFNLNEWVSSIWGNYFEIWVSFFVLLIAAVTVTLFYKRRKPKLDTLTESTPTIDPVQNHLNSAKKERVEGNVANYAQHLEQAVIEGNKSTSDIKINQLSDLRTVVEEDKQKNLERFLENHEQAKYSPVSPSQELWDQLWNDANALIPNVTKEK